MNNILELQSVSKHFGGIQAVDNVTFNIRRGSLVGLIGTNGAGKSTLFNLIMGLVPLSTGTVYLNGKDISRSTPEQIIQLGLGRTFQTPVGFHSLTVLENIMASADSPGEHLGRVLLGRFHQSERQLAEKAMSLLELVGLHSRAFELVDQLSGGELRMLEVARQLVRDPQMLLLDEPTAGVAPNLQERLTNLILTLHSNDMTILIVEHNLGFLIPLAEHIICLNYGQLLAQGTPETIRSNPDVIAAYLGDSHAA